MPYLAFFLKKNMQGPGMTVDFFPLSCLHSSFQEAFRVSCESSQN